MPNFATLRLTWEPRMLSILRIMVGLLYMEHGLAKILDFPHQPNHTPYALLALNPGLQGLLELVGGLLLALVYSPAPLPLSSWATWRSLTSWCMRREVSSHCSTVGSWQSSTASSSFTSGLPGVANGSSIGYVRQRLACRRAAPDHQRLTREHGTEWILSPVIGDRNDWFNGIRPSMTPLGSKAAGRLRNT